MTAPNPAADPRARLLITALRLLYEELDDDARPVAVSISAVSGGQLVTYTLNRRGEITRLVTDMDNLGRVAEVMQDGPLGEMVTDATVRDGPP